MSKLNVDELLQQMLSAAKQQLAQDWPKIESYMQQQLQLLAQSLVKFTDLYAAQQISKSQLQADLAEVRATAKMTLVTEAGLAEEMAEAVLQSTLTAIKDSINAAIGFGLL